MTPEEEAANNRLAMKMLRLDINRILLRWDPLNMKGLPGGDREYEKYAGPISVMVKKGAEPMEVARHLAGLMKTEWKLPVDNAKCVENAQKMVNAGAIFRGDTPDQKA